MSSFDNQVSVGLLVNPTLTGGASAAVSAGNIYAYVCNNVVVTRPAGALPALTGTIPNGATSAYVFYGDSAGNITVVKGNNVTGITSGVFSVSDFLPATSTGLSTINSNLAVIGVAIIVNNSGATFTGGSTLLNVAGLTVYLSNFPVSGL